MIFYTVIICFLAGYFLGAAKKAMLKGQLVSITAFIGAVFLLPFNKAEWFSEVPWLIFLSLEIGGILIMMSSINSKD